MSYKVNFNCMRIWFSKKKKKKCMRILMVYHTQSYGSYLTYKYIFFTIIVYWYLFTKSNIHPLKIFKNDNEYHHLLTISN